MSQQVRYQLWIAAAASVIFFTTLGATGLWDMDEALYTTCAREMFQRHDWIEPRFNGEMFPEKPPLMFWTMMAGFELLGVNEWGARLFSSIFGVATALAAFHLGRILCNVRVGLWTGLITASTIVFTVSARAATVDCALTFVTTLAFLLFVMARSTKPKGLGTSVPSDIPFPGASQPPLPSPPTLNLQYAIPMYACIGLAVLAKGPVGMVLPLAAMGLYLLVAEGWQNLLRSAWWMRPITALAVIAVVAVPWYVAVGVQTNGEWLRKFFIEFNLRPFKQPILGHGDTSSFDRAVAVLVSVSYYFYHILAVLVFFFPWSVFLGPTLVETIRRLRRRDAWRDGCLLATCWFGVWLVFWSVCKTKLPHYLLPAYPALALLTACFIDRWQTEPASMPRWWLRNAWISTILVGVGIMIAIPFVAARYLPGEAIIGLVGAIPALGGAWCWRKTSQGRHQQAAIAFAAAAVVFLTAMFGWAALRVDRHQNAKPMIQAIHDDCGNRGVVPIATYRFFRESTVFYAGHPVTKCEDDKEANRSADQELQTFLAKPKPAYVVTTDEYVPEIKKRFPGRLEEIFRQPRFLSPADEMVVLRAGK